MASAAPIDAVSSICPPKHHWRIKVRVVHKWIADSFGGESKPATLELILMDQYVSLIKIVCNFFVFSKLICVVGMHCMFILLGLICEYHFLMYFFLFVSGWEDSGNSEEDYVP